MYINLKNYDEHFIVNAMAKYGFEENDKQNISAIPNNEERYTSFSKKIKVGEYKDKDETNQYYLKLDF